MIVIPFIIRMDDNSRSEIIAKFASVTGVDEERAKFYLESSNWNLDVSISPISMSINFCKRHFSYRFFARRLVLPVTTMIMKEMLIKMYRVVTLMRRHPDIKYLPKNQKRNL